MKSMQNISKKLIGGIILIIVLTVAGWFWYEKMDNVASRDNLKQVANGYDWKIYRNDEYGIEFKYPNNSVVIVQPGSSKTFGTVLVVSQGIYEDLQEKDLSFQNNPLATLLGIGEGVEIRWDRSPLIAGYFKSNGFEKAFKILLSDGESATYPNGTPDQSSEFKIRVTLSKVMNAGGDNEIYVYESQYKNTNTGTSSMRQGLIWGEQDSFYGELQFISKDAPDSRLKDSAIQIALSFEMF